METEKLINICMDIVSRVIWVGAIACMSMGTAGSTDAAHALQAVVVPWCIASGMTMVLKPFRSITK